MPTPFHDPSSAFPANHTTAARTMTVNLYFTSLSSFCHPYTWWTQLAPRDN